MNRVVRMIADRVRMTTDIGGENEVPYLKEASAKTMLKLIVIFLMYNPNFSQNGDLSLNICMRSSTTFLPNGLKKS